MENSNLPLPLQASDVFHFDDSRPDFNSISNQNGFTFWYASDLMGMLGYQTEGAFKGVIQRAISACTSLNNVDIFDNFVPETREINGKKVKDYKLSRFACYLIAMNGDPKKQEIAMAQAYFATIAEAFQRYVEQAEDVERVLIRDEISDHENTLSSTAKAAGVTKYPFFQNAGYRGMYNMNISQLKTLKNIPKNRTPLDFMGKEELAANLFRVTQTEAKLRNDGTKGQRAAENVAQSVGRTVRETMIKISGTTPEQLAPSEDIRKIKSSLKSSAKAFAKIDKKKK